MTKKKKHKHDKKKSRERKPAAQVHEAPAEERGPLSARLLRVMFPLALCALTWAIWPYTADTANPIKTLVLHWTAVACGVIALAGTLLERRPFQRPRLFLEILLGVLILYAVAGVLSGYWGHSFQSVGWWFACVLVFLAAYHAYRTPDQVHRLMLFLCGAVAVASIYGFSQRAGMDPLGHWWAHVDTVVYENVPATFGNPNFAAHALLLAIVLACYLLTTRLRYAAAIFLVIFLTHLFMTGQRGSLAGLAAAAILAGSAFAVFRVTRRPLAAAGLSFALASVVAVTALAAAWMGAQTLTDRRAPLDGSLLLRYNAYYSAAQMILEKPIIGYGPGNYEIENVRFWTPYEQEWFATQRMYNRNVHNDVLEMAVDAGLPAAALYLAFLVFGMGYGVMYAARAGDDRRRRALGLALAAFFAAFAGDTLFGFNLRVPVSGVFLFVMAGCLEGLWRGRHAPAQSEALSGGALLWRSAAAAAAILFAVMNTYVFLGEQDYQRARSAAAFGADEEAIAFYEASEARMPWDWRPTREKAMAMLRQDETLDALETLRAALNKNPYYLVTLLPLAHTSMMFGVTPPQPDEHPEVTAARERALGEAALYAERVVELCAPMHEGHEILGRVTMVQAVQAAQQAGDDEEDVLSAAALTGMWERAAFHFEEALEHGSGNRGELYRLKAQAHMALDQPREAEAAFVAGARADPSNLRLWDTFYQLAAAQGGFEGMHGALLNTLERSRLTADQRMELLLWLAQVEAEGLGNPDAAQEALTEAAAIAPHREELWENYARFAARYGRMDAFLADARAAGPAAIASGASGAEASGALDALAMAFAEDGDIVEATTDLVALLAERDPMAEPPEGVAWVADLFVDELPRRDISGEDLGDALHNLGVVYHLLRNPQRSRQLLTSALPLVAPERSPSTAMVLAEAHLSVGDTALSLQVLNQTLAQHPDDLDLRLTYARILGMTGAPQEAIGHYEFILEEVGDIDEQSRERLELELEMLRMQAGG